MQQVMMVALIGAVLGGCVTSNEPATIQGACDAFEQPKSVVRGVSRDDRRWIAGQIETGIKICNWPRPKARQIAREIAS